METPVLKFEEFINEEINFTQYDNGVCRLSERWFYYNEEDDIIYGCDEKPVIDEKEVLFAFNPVSCTILLGAEEKQYDVNNPICLIQYNFDDKSVGIYSDNVVEYLSEFGFQGTDITSQQARNQIQDIFERSEDNKYILIYGDQMIASTFDVIEEN